MITFNIWKTLNSYEIVEHYSSWFNDDEITPTDKAGLCVLFVLLTPFTLIADILISPLEIIYIILRNKYKKQLKGKDDE